MVLDINGKKIEIGDMVRVVSNKFKFIKKNEIHEVTACFPSVMVKRNSFRYSGRHFEKVPQLTDLSKNDPLGLLQIV